MGLPTDNYVSIPDQDYGQENEELLPSPGQLSQSQTRQRNLGLCSKLSWIALTIFNVTLFSVAIGLASWSLLRTPSDRTCLRQMYPYSPAFEAVEYHDAEWQNDFDEQDEYRGPPTPERDQAWLNLWSVGDIVIQKSELGRLNKTWEESKHFYLPSVDGIAANLEVFHQLHCLDMIRRYTYLDWYTEETMPEDMKSTPSDYMRQHIDHCITTLRLSLMCTADVVPILMARGRGENEVNVDPDMRTTHKCRRFDKIQEWFIENSYTDYDCIQQKGRGCHIVPSELQ